MAVYKANITKFEKVAGWTGGPLKPTTTGAESSTASTVISAINTAVSGMTSMEEGEAIHVIVTIGPDAD